jgi:hypothetical protein
MSRVVNTNSPGKIRNQLMRTCAELLRHLSQKSEIDAEAQDMAAQLVFCLREIEDGIEASAMAWEKRDYWVKAERLRQRWVWAGNIAAKLEGLIRNGTWENMPAIMLGLVEHFSDIKIAKFTRNASEWAGAYQRLLDEVN